MPQPGVSGNYTIARLVSGKKGVRTPRPSAGSPPSFLLSPDPGRGHSGAEVQVLGGQFWEDCQKHSVTVFQYIGELCRYLVSQPRCVGAGPGQSHGGREVGSWQGPLRPLSQSQRKEAKRKKMEGEKEPGRFGPRILRAPEEEVQ